MYEFSGEEFKVNRVIMYVSNASFVTVIYLFGPFEFDFVELHGICS